MVNKLIKRIWFICLWLASLALAGCFHIPDEDWLLSSNKAETWDIKNDEMDEALDSFMEWINMISSERDKINKDEGATITTEESIIKDETEIQNIEEISINEEQKTENIIPEEQN